MNTLKYIFLFAAVFCFSCSDSEKELETAQLELSVDTKDFEDTASTAEIAVTTNSASWTAEVASEGRDWCQAEPRVTGTKNTLFIAVMNSEERYVRETTVTVRAGELVKELKVRQLGYEPAILVNPSIFTMNTLGGKIDFVVTTNVEVDFSVPEWVKPAVPDTRAVEMVATDHSYLVGMNKEDAKRTGEIIIKDKESDLKTSVIIDQKGLNEYDSENTDDIKGDLKVKVTRATASSEQNGENIENSIDGDYSTIYHSKWDNSGTNYFPIELTYYFDEAAEIDYLVYYPRTSGGNGLFKEVEIQYSEDGILFKKLMDKDFKGSATATKVLFDKPLENPKAIRFIVKSGAGDGQGFASCAEMEFYVKNPDNFDPLTLFTDVTCSELKAGITETEINACSYPFFKNIALFMLQGKYPREFRIGEFKAYLHPDVQSVENKTNPYSILDNPTGISVAEGEELIVMVGDMHGHDIGLRVQNLDLPGGDGFGGVTYPLSKGINKLKMTTKGLAYVMYHTDDYETAQPVKIHFASGKVNGYFDVAKHEASQWKTLLANATDKYFDVVGKYAHLTFPVARFRANTTDGKALIDVYDEIVRMEMEFMGLMKYNRVFKNRMYLHVMYHSYMYATTYHTAYNDETLNELCNVEQLKKGSIWGPAHEIGHCNQTRPGLKWLGTTEVTNNIHSLYVQTAFGNSSRLQSESMASEGGFTNRYEKAMVNTFTNGLAHAKEEDVFCKLVPVWQLELYLDKVLGKTDFYKDVYEYIRVNPDLATPGLQQTEFVYICSKIAGLNLVDFFTRWGFLTPVDVELDDYGKGRLTVTQQRIDEIKSRVEALGYPKPTARFEYITDNTVEVYKVAAAVIAGTATRNGQTLSMKGWSNVVAYEVYNGDQLIYVSAEPTFKVNTPLSEGFKVYAIAASGDKTLVNF